MLEVKCQEFTCLRQPRNSKELEKCNFKESAPGRENYLKINK